MKRRKNTQIIRPKIAGPAIRIPFIWNTGAPSATIGNYQVNTGAVTATVTSVNFGVGISGPVGNSTLRTTGNQITASATGNSAVSTISSR